MAKHAKLSASGAHRWMVCPGSIKMEEAFPDTTSSFAAEGTAAHDLAERCLTEDVTADFYKGHVFNGYEANMEMVEAVQIYLDYVRNHSGEKIIEQRVDFSPWVPGGFGTCDCLVINNNSVLAIDLKYGMGVKVDAKENKQAMLYALGALNDYEFMFEEFEKFKLAIVQPRLDHISEYEITKADLLKFGEAAKERAFAALKPNAELVPDNSACKFCRAKGSCKALAEHSLKMVAEDFVDVATPIEIKNSSILSTEEISALLPQLDSVSNWVTALKEHALKTLEQGDEIPGYKLVAGRSNRKWGDEKLASEALFEAGFYRHQIYTEKLITPTQAEKLIGKSNPILKAHVVKPEGKPTIAPIEDKRPALEFDPEQEFKDVS